MLLPLLLLSAASAVRDAALVERGVEEFAAWNVSRAWATWQAVVDDASSSVEALAAAHRNLAVVRGWEFAVDKPHGFRLNHRVDPLLARNWTASLHHARRSAFYSCGDAASAACAAAREVATYVFHKHHAVSAREALLNAWDRATAAKAAARGEPRYYVEVGVADFNALALHFEGSRSWAGLSVEPVPRLAAALPRSPTRAVEDAMVCAEDGAGTLMVADEAAVGARTQYLGMSHAADAPDRPDVAPGVFAAVAARCVSLPTLFAARGVGEVDLLKVDAEGADYDIVAAALAHAAATQRPIHRIAFESNLRSGAQVDVFAEDAARPDAFGARRDATLARLRAARYDCACDATDCDCVGPIAYDGV